MVMQGDAAVTPLSQILNDEQAEMAARIAVCRTLCKLGPNAKPALKRAIGGEPWPIPVNAHIKFAKPFKISDYYTQEKKQKRKAIEKMTDRLRTDMQSMLDKSIELTPYIVKPYDIGE